MHEKRRKRSVAIQSTDYLNQENQNGSQTARLTKKAGFRNLLRKSVTILSRENEESESLHLPGDRTTKAVQATFSEGNASQQQGRGQSFELPYSRKQSITRDGESRTTTSDLVTIIERGVETSHPGTSGMSERFSAVSFPSQVNDIYVEREGSLAIVHSFGEKSVPHSVSSNLAYFYGSQGSRRFSDETVLLNEDYESYDHANTARRQRNNFPNSRRLICCWKRDSSIDSELTRPLPIEYGALQEVEETVCRICHEGEEVEPLIQPCLCKGSIGSVHANCLKLWLEQSNTSRCELCNYPYAIRQNKKYTKCVSIRVYYKTVVDRRNKVIAWKVYEYDNSMLLFQLIYTPPTPLINFISAPHIFIDRALVYDVISFVVITPLTLVGVVMCIQASLFSPGATSDSNFQMGYITKIGMTMLSGTIMVAYLIWLYTLISFHYKSWRKWYGNCYDVEVIPVRMTSEERLQASNLLSEETTRRQLSAEQGSTLVTLLHSPRNYSFYRRLSVATEHGTPV